MNRTAFAAILLGAALASLPGPARAANSEPGEMETYYVGLIYKGPAWTPGETPEIMEIQKAHLANITRLAGTGKLILAGPFADGGDLRGMFVFRVPSFEEAKELCDTDPAVKAGRLRVEIHPWWSAKGIAIVQPPDSAGASRER